MSIYEHGHFIDLDSKKRLIPIQDAVYTISAEDNAFEIVDEAVKKTDVLDSAKKAAWALVKFGAGKHGKIMNAGEQLFFRVGNSSRVPGDESFQYMFVCTLLEDLYLFLVKGENGEDEGDWRLAKCKCVLSECIMGGLTLSENITADSLNQLFSNTVQFYFRMQRSASANSFDTFFNYKKGMQINFGDAIYRRYDGLIKARLDFVAKQKQVR
jgi:hypothetical protein